MSIRPRWRLAVAVAVAVVVAALVGYLALTRGQAPPAVTAVTDVAAPNSAPDQIASGTVGNASWQIIVTPSPYTRGETCWSGHGPAFGSLLESTGEECWPADRPLSPVQFLNLAQNQVQVGVGPVRADVTSIMLRLDDGQQLKLVPVQRHGHRMVAYVIPRQVKIASATAYLNTGKYETTSPYNSPDGPSLFGRLWVWHSPRGH